MAYLGLTTRDGSCAICDKRVPKGTLVYFDRTKSQGNHLAHKECYDDLRASRDVQPKAGTEILSHEKLDPPF